MELIVVNKESGRRYIAIKNGATVRVKRIDDGKEFNLSDVNFKRKYTPERKKTSSNFFEITEPDPERFNFANMVLYPECISAVRMGINRVINRDKLEEVWNISKLEPTARAILNFYGSPGTGKSLAAKAIASELDRPLFQASYDRLISQWMGETGKNLAAMFKEAQEQEAIVLLDEADTLCSTRLSMHESRCSAASEHNNCRNVFMQNLDAFDGVVILTTNFFSNYDAALLRRMAAHIEFKAPDKAMRELLFRRHIPTFNRVRGELDWNAISETSDGLTGGDVYTVVVNAINLASLDPDPDNWWLTNEILLGEIARTKASKVAHVQPRRRPLKDAVNEAERPE